MNIHTFVLLAQNLSCTDCITEYMGMDHIVDCLTHFLFGDYMAGLQMQLHC